MTEERFIDLETRLAHQDNLINELNDAVTQQQARLMHLDELCQSLLARVRHLGETLPDADPGDERPPHY